MVNRSSTARAGFTLIEVLVVITIITLALSITVPAIWKGLSKTRLNAYVRELSATLRYARSQAVTQKARVTVSIDIDQNKYTLREPSRSTKGKTETADRNEKVQNSDDPAQDRESYPAQDDKSQILPYKIVGFRQMSDGPVVKTGVVPINFFPLGNSDGGEIIIQGNKENLSYLIVIDRTTGRVKIHEERTW